MSLKLSYRKCTFLNQPNWYPSLTLRLEPHAPFYPPFCCRGKSTAISGIPNADKSSLKDVQVKDQNNELLAKIWENVPAKRHHRDTDAQTLAKFLLNRDESREMDGVSKISAVPDKIAQKQAESVLFPVADSSWLPKPRLFKRVPGIDDEYLEKLAMFEKEIGIHFTTRLLLLQAFIHPSVVKPSLFNNLREASMITNGRLVPLGESVMRLACTFYLVQRSPQTKGTIQAQLLEKCLDHTMLRSIADTYKLAELLLIDENAIATEVSKTETYGSGLLALIGAIYLDQGLLVAQKVCMQHIIPRIEPRLENLIQNLRKHSE